MILGTHARKRRKTRLMGRYTNMTRQQLQDMADTIAKEADIKKPKLFISIRNPMPKWATMSGSYYGITDIDDHPTTRQSIARIWINVKLCKADKMPLEQVLAHEVGHVRNWTKIFSAIDERLAEDFEYNYMRYRLKE